jgi:hypothetical protein
MFEDDIEATDDEAEPIRLPITVTGSTASLVNVTGSTSSLIEVTGSTWQAVHVTGGAS